MVARRLIRHLSYMCGSKDQNKMYKSKVKILKSIVSHVKMHKNNFKTQSSMLGSTSDSGEYLLHTMNTPGTLTDPFHSAAKVGCWEEGIV